MMSPTIMMPTKSTTAMMSSVIGYCCYMCNYVIVINEFRSRICKGLLRATLDNFAYICENCVPFHFVKK